MRTSIFSVALVSLLSLCNVGCVKTMIANGQVEATRKASPAFDTVGDYELARSAASAGLVQFEGMHRLLPDNQDALFLLAKGWVGYGFAFVEDDWEAAVDADNDDLAEYHRARARQAYDRGLGYGREMLRATDDGLDKALKSNDSLRKWLKENFTSADDVPNLFWTGYAWLARINLYQEEPELVGELYIPVAMLERANELDPTYQTYGAMTALAAYHARMPTATEEMKQSRQMFETALAKTQRKTLMVQLNYATKFACRTGEKALYEKLLNEVVNAKDIDPTQRLSNTIAKRRAKRYLTRARMSNCAFD